MFHARETALSLIFYVVSMPLGATSIAQDQPELLLSNDGPAILDSNLTFFASLNDSDHEYRFVFLDNTEYPRKHVVTGEQNVSVSLNYEKGRYQQGRYVMTVNVHRKDSSEEWNDLIVSGKMEFQLSEFMVGEIVVHQEGADDDYFATNKEITFKAVIHDPSGYFNDKLISYSWSVDDVRYSDIDDSFAYNFTKHGKYHVTVTTVAYGIVEGVYRDTFKWGYFDKWISVEEPVTTINVTGNTFLRHGDLLSLNLSCDGSGSFEYCWDVVPANETDINITCEEPVVSTTCNFLIIRYFSKAGSHYIKVFAGNFLSNQQKTIEVRIYDVSRQPQLSTVIIPIVCSVLTIVIIIMGVAYHIQHRRQYRVEVADFDFHQTEDLVEKTFFERLRESFKKQFSYQNVNDNSENNQ